MIIIVGALTVTLCVFGGFAAHGGKLLALWQPNELVIIGGAGVGALFIMAPMSKVKDVVKQALGALKFKETTKEQYMEVLLCMYELVKTAKGNLLGLEAHVENPENSDIFKRYPGVLHNHHAVHFICDTLKVQISSPVSPYDLEDLMDIDLSGTHDDEAKAAGYIATIADSFPGLGIVAAVMGVVNTMGKLTEGKEVIGHSVAAALVGTFIGILLSYGYFGPLAKKIEAINSESGKYMEVIKVALLAFAKDCSPKVCIEFARRSIPPHVRPTFGEMDQATTSAGKAAA